jgi:predicted RNA-binding protein associated with RNAse of E/G family
VANKNLPRPVSIVYKRLPNDIRRLPGVLRRVSAARLVIESPIVVERPQRVFGRIIADSGFLAIWFLYRNRWYDVGKFYDRQRNLVGYYCDIIKPLNKLLRTLGKTSKITDLFLDLWITPEGDYAVLDEDEFEEALEQRFLSKNVADQARQQMDSLIQKVRTRHFPPLSVQKVEPS